MFTLPSHAKVVPGRFGVPPAVFIDLFVSDPGAGSSDVRGTTGTGGISLPVVISGLPVGSGLNIIPGFFAGAQQFTDLLFYDPATGAAQFHTTNGLGSMPVIGGPTLPAGRRMVAGTIGEPRFHSDLFIYDPQSGTAQVRGANGSGGLSPPAT